MEWRASAGPLAVFPVAHCGPKWPLMRGDKWSLCQLMLQNTCSYRLDLHCLKHPTVRGDSALHAGCFPSLLAKGNSGQCVCQQCPVAPHIYFPPLVPKIACWPAHLAGWRAAPTVGQVDGGEAGFRYFCEWIVCRWGCVWQKVTQTYDKTCTGSIK